MSGAQFGFVVLFFQTKHQPHPEEPGSVCMYSVKLPQIKAGNSVIISEAVLFSMQM